MNEIIVAEPSHLREKSTTVRVWKIASYPQILSRQTKNFTLHVSKIYVICGGPS